MFLSRQKHNNKFKRNTIFSQFDKIAYTLYLKFAEKSKPKRKRYQLNTVKI